MTLRNNLLDALELYDTYLAHQNGEYATDEGLTIMKEIFAGVADGDKAFVFSTFLQFLRDAGVQFNTTQFEAA